MAEDATLCSNPGEEHIARRKSAKGWLFYDHPNSYKSGYFGSPEERDRAVRAYIDQQIQQKKEFEDKRKEQKQLLAMD